MPVVHATDVDQAEYERFLDAFAARPGPALAYHYPFYLRFLAATAYPLSEPRFMVARDSAGVLAGVLPAIHVRTPDVSAWLSLAYFGPNAGALVRAGDGADAARLTRALVMAAQADARARSCGSMTICTPLDAPPEPYRDALDAPEFEIERVAQCLELPANAGESPWPRKVRYDIRRAASLGLTTRPIGDESELDRVWDIYRRNCEDAGIPVKRREHVRALFRTAGRHGIFLLAEHGGAIVAGLICLMGGGVVSYYLPCTRAESRPRQPGLLLLDHAVADARGAGCRLLNFEASPRSVPEEYERAPSRPASPAKPPNDLSGHARAARLLGARSAFGRAPSESSVYQFKARCGGTPVPYRVFVKLLGAHVLDKYRALTAAGLAAQVPHAFVVPFAALTAGDAQ